MKRIFFTLFYILCITYNVFGQEPAQSIGNSKGATKLLGRVYVDSGFFLPIKISGWSPLREGAIAWDTVNHRIVNWTGSSWTQPSAVLDTISADSRYLRLNGGPLTGPLLGTIGNFSVKITTDTVSANVIALPGFARITSQSTSTLFTSILAFETPTANRTITVPNLSGRIAVIGSGNAGRLQVDSIYALDDILFGYNSAAHQFIRTNNVSTTGRKGISLGNGVNTAMQVYAGGNNTLGAWTESDRTLVIGTGFGGGGGSLETILFHSAGIGNMGALSAANNRAYWYMPTTFSNEVVVGGNLIFGGGSGGSNRLYWDGAGRYILRSDFDVLTIQGGINDANKRQIDFNTGNTQSAYIDISGLFWKSSASPSISSSDNSLKFATTEFVKQQNYLTGSGSSNRIPYYNGTYSLTNDATFTYNGTTLTARTASFTSSTDGAIVSLTRNNGSYTWSLGQDAATSFFRLYNNSGTTRLSVNPDNGDLHLTGYLYMANVGMYNSSTGQYIIPESGGWSLNGGHIRTGNTPGGNGNKIKLGGYYGQGYGTGTKFVWQIQIEGTTLYVEAWTSWATATEPVAVVEAPDFLKNAKTISLTKVDPK